MTDTDLDFIEANQLMQAIDERLEKLYAQQARIHQLAPRDADFAQAERSQAVRALESAKRKLSVRWYSDIPEPVDEVDVAKRMADIEDEWERVAG